MIRLEGVSFRYRSAPEPALSEVTCHIRPGELVGLLGRSGSGRSTLASTLNGTIPHLVRGELRGRISIAGQDIQGLRPRDLADRVGFLFQDFEAQLFSTNVALEVAFGPENLGVPRAEIARRVDRCLRLARLEVLHHKAPAGLSGGQKQRLALASVLALEPRALVLDEPTSDLDPAGRRDLWEAIRRLREERALTLLIIDPETDEVGWADRLIVLDRGRVALSGTPAELWSEGDRLDALGVKGFTLARLATALGLAERWQDTDGAAAAIRAAGWRVAEGAADRLRRADDERASGGALLDVEDLTHRYPDGTEALAGVSCAIRRGEFVAILGQNGSGKTTLVKHFNGILTPTAGDIRLSGQSLRGQSLARLSRHVGLVFQNPDHQIFAERIRDEVAFGPRLQGLSENEVSRRVEEALEAVGLSDAGDLDPFILTKGSRQRVAVASTLATKPELIILDEPTTGLDHRELLGMMALIQRLNQAGHTILIVTHAMAVAATYVRRVILMQDGRIVREGPTREIFGNESGLFDLGLTPPPVVQVANRLGVPALTLDELVTSLTRAAEPPNRRTPERSSEAP
ncbi:MAG: ATP-binding cassette domain-containing protein [candidate division NC10 bacterium]|nr:ATP-binding cassette domain-containing protein [candidate division NC10 bacterium]